jgi:hypothetical protein
MDSKKIHRFIGLAMLLPLLAWAVTGLIFFIKPGYEGAYEKLYLKTYPINHNISIGSDNNWQEFRVIRSILGLHLLAKDNGEINQYDLQTLQIKSKPSESDIKRLIEDAISSNPQRYGTIKHIHDESIFTTTGIEVKLDWNTLKLSQYGLDKRIIGLMYKVHYLQWTPWAVVNQILGILGLILLVTLTFFGIKIYVSNRKP